MPGGGSLTHILRISESSLAASQRGIETVSNNLTNLGVDNRSRQVFRQTSQSVDGVGGGVTSSVIVRATDARLVREIQMSSTTLKECETKDFYAARMEQFLGGPNSNSSFTSSLTKFATSLQALSATPSDIVLQRQVVDAAGNFCTKMNQITNGIQSLRSEIDTDISSTVQILNSKLELISRLNAAMVTAKISSSSTVEIEDMRDQVIQEIGEIIDLKTYTNESGVISLFTSHGDPLVNQAIYPLQYESVGDMTAHVEYPGNINGIILAGHDVTQNILSGKLKALIDLRDKTLPNHQSSFDTLAVGFRDEMNAIHNKGTGLPPPSKLTGSKPTQVTDSFGATGTLRIAFLDVSGKFTDAPIDFDLSTVSTIQELVDGLNARSSGVASLNTKGQFVLQAPPGKRIALGEVGGATHEASTQKGFSHFFGMNDFFVATPASFDSTDLGIANTLKVHPDIFKNPSYLSRGALNESLMAGPDGSADEKIGVSSLRNNISLELLQKLSAVDIEFSGVGDFSSQISSLIDYAGSILTFISLDAAKVSQELQFQESLVDDLKGRLSNIAGINEEQELSNMILFQQTYKASAKMMQVVDSFLELTIDLLRVR